MSNRSAERPLGDVSDTALQFTLKNLGKLKRKMLAQGDWDDDECCGCVMTVNNAVVKNSAYPPLSRITNWLVAQGRTGWSNAFKDMSGTNTWDCLRLYELNDDFKGTPSERYTFVYNAVKQELDNRGIAA